jgi:hypothetical protein
VVFFSAAGHRIDAHSYAHAFGTSLLVQAGFCVLVAALVQLLQRARQAGAASAPEAA